MLPNLRFVTMAAFTIFLVAMVFGCTQEAIDDSSLTVNGFPASLRVGDTTDDFHCTKQVRNELGRMETQESYPNIFFESGDSSIVMPEGRRLLGLKKGQTSLVAHDKSSRLQSDSLILNVE